MDFARPITCQQCPAHRHRPAALGRFVCGCPKQPRSRRLDLARGLCLRSPSSNCPLAPPGLHIPIAGGRGPDSGETRRRALSSHAIRGSSDKSGRQLGVPCQRRSVTPGIPGMPCPNAGISTSQQVSLPAICRATPRFEPWDASEGNVHF
jgi:hypothetical protein